MIETGYFPELQAILGTAGLLTEPDVLAPYQTGARGDKGRAAFVARPASTAEVSDLLRVCCRHDIALVPQSANTGLVAGSTPDMSGTQGILSFDRLRSRFELDIENRSLRVDAGFRLSEINRRLDSSGLFFPIDLGADPCAGGMVATNTGGTRFLRYGDVRRNILGLQVVLADRQGTVLHLDRGLRKDNSGIDWKQLFIGTAGAFGVISECVFNLERSPVQTATAYLAPRSTRHVTELLIAMERRFGARLSAFELMSSSAINCALNYMPSLRNPFPRESSAEYIILVEVSQDWAPREGDPTLETHLEAALADIWTLPDAPLTNALIGASQDMWALRHALSEGVRRAGHLVAFDLSFSRGGIMPFLGHMRRELPAIFPNLRICDFGHVGDGGVHFNLVLPSRERLVPEQSLVEEIREFVIGSAVEEYGGSFSAEHGIGRKNQHVHDRYTPQDLKRLGAGLKQLTSPAKLGAARFGWPA